MPAHSEKRVLPYRQEQLYELVADVEDYPNFVPWCAGLRVLQRSQGFIDAEMAVGFSVLRERFVSRITLDPIESIEVTYLSGPFDRLDNRWSFRTVGGGCEVGFFIDFDFRSILLRKVAGPVFHEGVRRTVLAFERRAAERCAPA